MTDTDDILVACMYCIWIGTSDQGVESDDPDGTIHVLCPKCGNDVTMVDFGEDVQ